MTTANRQHRDLCSTNEFAKIFDYRGPVKIKITERAAQNDSVGLELVHRCVHASQMSNVSGRVLYETRYVVEDIFNCELGYRAFTLNLGRGFFAPFFVANFREIFLVTQKVIYNQNPGRLNALLNGFVATEGLLIEGKGKWFCHVVWPVFVK